MILNILQICCIFPERHFHNCDKIKLNTELNTKISFASLIIYLLITFRNYVHNSPFQIHLNLIAFSENYHNNLKMYKRHFSNVIIVEVKFYNLSNMISCSITTLYINIYTATNMTNNLQ